MSILASLPGIVAGVAGSLFHAATLREPGDDVPDGQGGYIPGAATNIPCAALLADYSDALRGLSNGAIEARDRKATVLGASLPAGKVPQIGWGVAIEGSEWSVVRVVRDPAGATYDLQIRPA